MQNRESASSKNEGFVVIELCHQTPYAITGKANTMLRYYITSRDTELYDNTEANLPAFEPG